MGMGIAVGVLTYGGAARTYATLNPADISPTLTLSGGNLTVDMAHFASINGGVRATIGVSAGKWWCEVILNSTQDDDGMIGVANIGADMTNIGGDTNSWGLQGAYGFLGVRYNGGTIGAGFAGYNPGDIINMAINMTTHELTYYKNGVVNGSIIGGIPATTYVVIGQYDLGFLAAGNNFTCNFGASPFTYAPPAGYNSGIYM